MTTNNTNPLAGIIIIGNEILSGQIRDLNSQKIIRKLVKIGVITSEVRIIADNKQAIIKTVLDFSNKYDYVFTTGGIGSTHDDITTQSITEAFGEKYILKMHVKESIKKHYKMIGEDLNQAREKMAYFPESARLLDSNVSVPGFNVKNVFVLAGVPYIMESMLISALKMIKGGNVIKKKSIDLMIIESKIAESLAYIQGKYLDVEIGSYPFIKNGRNGTSIVLRSCNYKLLNKAFFEVSSFYKDFI